MPQGDGALQPVVQARVHDGATPLFSVRDLGQDVVPHIAQLLGWRWPAGRSAGSLLLRIIRTNLKTCCPPKTKLAGWLAGWWLFAAWLVWLASGWGWLACGWLLAGFGWLGFLPVFLACLAETQLRGILQAYLGVVMLQPHACAQHFRFRILGRQGRFLDGQVSGPKKSISAAPVIAAVNSVSNGMC